VGNVEIDLWYEEEIMKSVRNVYKFIELLFSN